jgi:Protein of unknown function (DUF4233)
MSEPRVTEGADPTDETDPTQETGPSAPTAEQIELRAQRAGKAIRRSLAAVLCLEAFSVLLVPRAIAQTSVGLGSTKTVILIALAVVLVFVGAMVRYPWGIGLGTFFQLTMIAVGFWTYAFFVVAALFIGVWIYLLKLRYELVGTPGGLHLLY